MRWKLLVITSLFAAAIGAGITLIAFPMLMNMPLREPFFTLLTSRLSPLLYAAPGSIAAAIFIYRHTARRRKLQAAMTALLSILLAFALIACAGYFLTVRA